MAAWLHLLALLLLVNSYIPTASAQTRPPSDAVRASLIADVDRIVPGQPFRLGLLLQHRPEWHTYWRNPGDSGLPTQFEPQLPAGFETGQIQWPRPSRFLIGPLANLGFDRDVLLVRSVQTPATVASQTVTVELLAQWLVCRDVCIPGEQRLTLDLPVAADGQPDATGEHAWRFEDAAREQPVDTVPVPAALVDRSIHLHIPEQAAPRAARLEYFAYQPETVHHAGAQRLFRLPDGQGWRLEVPLNTALADGIAGSNSVEAALQGLLVIDDSRSLSVAGNLVDDAAGFSGGRLHAEITGHVAEFMAGQQGAASALIAATRGGGSVLADRLGGQTTGSSSGSVLSARATGPAVSTPPPAAAASSVSMTLPLALAFALVGGLILNLMPCVFPVIGLKILGFAGSGTGRGESLTNAQRRHVRLGCLWFALGVVLSFLVLAALLITLKVAGQAIGWGFQLQSPPFVALMALLFVAIGLNFAGLFAVGNRLTQLGQYDQPAPADSNAGARPVPSFFSGVLAVLVATPCTAPFMGSALGYTLSQPALVTLLVFSVLGIGMALPYLVLGLMPGWLRWLPRPGRWMETFKQLLAFPMFAAAAWLVWVLGQQAGLNGVLWLLVGMIVLAFGLWILGRFAQGGGRMTEAALALSLVLVGSAVALSWPVNQGLPDTSLNTPNKPVTSGLPGKPAWQPWSTAAVQQALSRGQPVFIDFTAAWCVTCQVNKRLVLSQQSVKNAFAQRNIQLMQADWTNQDPAITAELARHGRNSIPFYLLYRPDGQPPTVLPEILTEKAVLDAIGAS